MLDIMKNAKNAMKAFETALKAQTSNMGNMDTVGYKSLKYSFKTVFNQVLNGGSGGDSDVGGTNPVQYGANVTLSNIFVDFSQGEIGEGTDLDIAIQGAGLFIVSPDNGQTFLYSRAGNFKRNGLGELLDNSGRAVYGYKADTDGIIDTSQLVPIKPGIGPNSGWKSKGSDGMFMEDNTKEDSKPLFQIALTDFPNKAGLIQYDGTTFKSSSAAGVPFQINVANKDGYGAVLSNSIEKSNVFFIGETVDAIEVQRAMSASLTAIKIASEQIQTVIQQVGA